MRNGPRLQRIHCFILHIWHILCSTYYVKHCITILLAVHCPTMSTQGLLCVGHCAECKDEMIHRVDTVPGLTDIAAFWGSQKSKQRNMACVTSVIHHGLLAFDLLSI